MSEKRFTIESTATELELYDNGKQIGEFTHHEWVARSVDYVVDLLNSLSEENEKLKEQNRKLYKLALTCKTIGDDV